MDSSRFHSKWGSRLFDLSYKLITDVRPTRWFAATLTQWLAARTIRRAVLEQRPGRRGLDLPGHHGGARRPAGQGQDRRPGRLGDHRPGGAALLGAPRRRPSPDHPPRVGRGGSRRSLPGRTCAAFAGSPTSASTTPATKAEARQRPRPAGRGPDGDRLGWGLGGRRPGGRRARRRLACPRRDGRLPLRPERPAPRRARAPLRGRAAGAGRGLHRADARLVRGRRRARPLHRGPDGARGDHARVAGSSPTAGAWATCGSTTRRSSASAWPRSQRSRQELEDGAGAGTCRAAASRTSPSPGCRRRASAVLGLADGELGDAGRARQQAGAGERRPLAPPPAPRRPAACCSSSRRRPAAPSPRGSRSA